MSYRAFKRLLGETSLERKCRFLFGAFILLLIILSFWFYSWRTEHLAYDQLVTSSRLLVPALVAEQHRTGAGEKPAAERAMVEVREYWYDKVWPQGAPPEKDNPRLVRRFIKPDDPEKKSPDTAGNERLDEF